jgi:hypothetical protein
MLNPYNVKIKVYCKDDAEAKKVQEAVNDIASDFNLVGSELLNFYAMYKRNEGVLRPIITDVAKRGLSVIGKYIFSLSKLKLK